SNGQGHQGGGGSSLSMRAITWRMRRRWVAGKDARSSEASLSAKPEGALPSHMVGTSGVTSSTKSSISRSHGCGYGSDHDAIRALSRKPPARYCPSGQGMHVTGEVLGLARVPGVVSPGRRCSRIILHRTAGSEGADRGNPL